MKVTIHSKIEADRNKVWDLYTSPEHIVNWNFASEDWCCPSAENDLVVGGKYKARMEARDGSFGFDLEATYESLTPGKDFAFIMADGRKVEVSMDDGAGLTSVTIVFDAETENPVDMQRDGWQSILDNFKRYVEKN